MDLKKASTFLPLGGIVLIGLGVLKASVYYNYFGIPIMSYLSTSDVLTLFLNDYSSILVLLIIGYVHFDVSDKLITTIHNLIGEEEFDQILRKMKWVTVVISTVLVLLFFFRSIAPSSNIPTTISIYLLVFFAHNTVTFLFIRKNVTNDKGFFLFENILKLISGIIVICTIPLLALKDIRRIELNKGPRITLELENADYMKSDATTVYLGKAGEYYFFRNAKTHAVAVIPSKLVKTETIEITQ